MHHLSLDERRLSGPMLTALTREVAARGIPFRFCARGSSMYPFIQDGDVISLAPLGGRLPRFGEVIAYVRPGTQNLVVHRIVGCARATYYFQGDNCSGHPDGWVSKAALLGSVSRVEHFGRCQRFGLGPEGRLIALLSRLGILERLVFIAIRLNSVLRK